jgi:hypothetical protein
VNSGDMGPVTRIAAYRAMSARETPAALAAGPRAHAPNLELVGDAGKRRRARGRGAPAVDGGAGSEVRGRPIDRAHSQRIDLLPETDAFSVEVGVSAFVCAPCEYRRQ